MGSLSARSRRPVLEPPVAVFQREVQHVAGWADAEPAQRLPAGRGGEQPVQDEQALARLRRRGDDAEPGGHQAGHIVCQRGEVPRVEPPAVPQLDQEQCPECPECPFRRSAGQNFANGSGGECPKCRTRARRLRDRATRTRTSPASWRTRRTPRRPSAGGRPGRARSRSLPPVRAVEVRGPGDAGRPGGELGCAVARAAPGAITPASACRSRGAARPTAAGSARPRPRARAGRAWRAPAPSA